VRRSLPVSDYP